MRLLNSLVVASTLVLSGASNGKADEPPKFKQIETLFENLEDMEKRAQKLFEKICKSRLRFKKIRLETTGKDTNSKFIDRCEERMKKPNNC